MHLLKAIISALRELPFSVARRSPDPTRSQRGTALVEAMAAIAITASVGVSALSLVSISAATSSDVSAEATASWIAASQAEKMQAAPYLVTPGQYSAIAAPTGFVVSNTTSDIVGGDPAIQVVTVSVTKAGESIVSVAFVKVDR